MNAELMEYTSDMLKEHEGLSLKPYQDTTGRTTIGFGRNIQEQGISKLEAELMLQGDLLRSAFEASVHVPHFKYLSMERQAALISMLFNLGLTRFLKFKRMLAALNEQNYEEAAKEMLDSRWARQVKTRAVQLAEVMRGKSL